MRPQKVEIKDGDEFGWLTVIEEVGKDAYGHRMYRARCRCGNESTVQRGFLLKGNGKCIECGRNNKKTQESVKIVGQTINNWTVTAMAGHNPSGTRLYHCICNSCNQKNIKSKAQMKRNVTGKCENCFPDYNFVIEGNVATGTLPDGTQFVIDAEDVPFVSSKRWRIHKGYIISDNRVTKERLHRLLVGASDDLMVDHKNRNPLDCRKSNLRMVTNQQNSMNRSLMDCSTTGFVGVSFVTSRQKYRAQIGLNNRDIYLGSSIDAVICAQMYNIASSFLFGEFKGHHNDVPPPSAELFNRMMQKLKPYKKEAELATQSCGHFLFEEAV